MICDRCHGTGLVTYRQRKRSGGMHSWSEVCPECGGQRFTHCCEGDRACAESDTDGDEVER